MKTIYKIGIIIIVVSALVFIWGSMTYLLTYTDTSETIQNPDPFVIPAIISAFVIMGIVPIMVYYMSKSSTQKIIFVSLSAIGIFFTFYGILRLIIELRA